MIPEAADVADVFIFGGLAKVFELDKRGEFGDRWSIKQKRRECPRVRKQARRQFENSQPPKPMTSNGAQHLRQARRAAAAFNQSHLTAVGAVSSAVAAHVVSRRWLSFCR
jgi:hypothetical protein